MSAIVPLTWATPAASESYTAAPVLGRTLGVFAGAQNHLTGIHVPGFCPALAYQDPPEATTADDIGYIEGPAQHHESVRLPYYIPAGVTLLGVHVTVLSYGSGDVTPPPVVAVSLYNTIGHVIDVGWTATRPQVGGSEFRAGYVNIWLQAISVWALRPTLIPVLPVAPANVLVPRTSPTYLGTAGKDDGMSVVHVDCEYARVVSVYVLPVPSPTLP